MPAERTSCIALKVYEELSAEAQESTEVCETNDISKLIAQEVEGLKKNRNSVFVPHSTQAKGVLFFGCQEGYSKVCKYVSQEII